MIRLSKYLSFLIILLLIYSACGTHQNSIKNESEISPEQLNQYLDNKQEVLILDVRTPKEYTGELGHIPGSILRPLQEIESWISEFDSLKSKKIIMVCRSGNRSGYTTKYFIEKGFSDVYNLVGGMRAWNKAKYPIEKNLPENYE